MDVQGCTLSAQGDPCAGGCNLISIVEDALFLIDGELRLDLSAPPGGCVPSEVEVLEYATCADALGYEVTVSLYDAADTLLAAASSPASSSGSTRTILVQASSAAASAAIRTPYGCVRSVTVR
jgi:hypothetical protein